MKKKLLLAFSFCALLSACGGGSDGEASRQETQSAAGLWIGTTSSNRSITGIVLSDGTYYVLYASPGTSTVGGVVQGTGTQSGETFTSTNAKDFNLEGLGITPASVTATVKTKQSWSGTISYSGTAVGFTSAYDADFEKAPSLATIAGSYSGAVVISRGHENATLTIAANGNISGQGSSGCTITGSISPRTDGNVYNASVTFGQAPCYFAGQTFTGIAYYDEGEKRLYAAAPNASRTDGILFIGDK